MDQKYKRLAEELGVSEAEAEKTVLEVVDAVANELELHIRTAVATSGNKSLITLMEAAHPLALDKAIANVRGFYETETNS